MKKIKTKHLVYLLAALVTLISFQNCGSAFESIEILENYSPPKQNLEMINPDTENVDLPIDSQNPSEISPDDVPVVVPETPVTPPVVVEEPKPEPEPEPEVVISPGGNCSLDEQIFLANDNDIVVIEAENTQMKGKWEQRSPINGSTGPGIIVYRRSDSPNDRSHSYDGVSELVYNVFVNESGVYKFSYRGARFKGSYSYTVFGNHDNVNCPSSKKNCTHADLNNDAFVSTSNGLSPTKLFAGVGSSTDSWRIARTFDSNHKKSTAQVNLKESLNKIFIRGRSTFFAIDKIFIFKGNQPNEKSQQSKIGCP